MSVELFLQTVVNASYAASYMALIAVGLVLIFGVMGVINFAHGELYMAGAYAVVGLYAGAGFPFFNLYRLAVVARGKKLITDVEDTKGLSFSARFTMRFFGFLFRYNALRTRRGWQMVATAVNPG